MGNPECGTPLLQMMAYSLSQGKRNQLKIDIVQFFIDRSANLSRVISAGCEIESSALEMSINLHRFDIAQLLIKEKVDPIYGGHPDLRPIFTEYSTFGTNEFLKWLLGDYLKNEIADFVDRLIADDVFSKFTMRNTLANEWGRNADHALLLCGHEEAISRLLSRKPELLNECDPFERTALHIAADKGDLESVKILLNR